MSIIDILAWLFFITIPVCVIAGGISIAVLVVVARTLGLWVAVLFGCFFAVSVIFMIKKDKKDSQYEISLRIKEMNGEPLTPMEYRVLHPDESWKHRYPGPGYYQPK
jgi:Ca2+/Na+ antiporter